MTKIARPKSKKRGRPRKVVPQKIVEPIKKLLSEPLDIQDSDWESEGGYVPPSKEDIITDKMKSRKKQWDSLDDFTKLRLQMTEEQFLSAEDVTGFGPNSYFTPLSERS